MWRGKRCYRRILIGLPSIIHPTTPGLLPPTKVEVNGFARVCLSVCLLARLLKNACMDLDEMLRVDRCRYMDELINFWARSGLQYRCRNRIASSDIVCAAYDIVCIRMRNFITPEKSHVQVLVHVQVAAATRGFKMVLFTSSRGNTFVGGICALPNALLGGCFLYSTDEVYNKKV